MANETTIRVVIFETDGIWVAQGLERDICAQGPDVETAKRRFEQACTLEAAHRLALFGDSVHGLDPAPRRFFEMWEGSDRPFEPNGRSADYRIAA